MTRSEILEKLRALEPAFASLGVGEVRLFGSRARGDAFSQSDIDIAVAPVEGGSLDPQAVLSIYGLLGDAFGYDIAVDVVVLPSSNPEINSAVQRDGAIAFA
jgi:predicted nucleotidyltransferase